MNEYFVQKKKIDESDDIDKVGGRIMLTLSGKIVVNVEASYIETYLRKKGYVRTE